jgi:hypothetical protein
MKINPVIVTHWAKMMAKPVTINFEGVVMFKDYEWVFNALLFVSLIYTAIILGKAIYLGEI